LASSTRDRRRLDDIELLRHERRQRLAIDPVPHCASWFTSVNPETVPTTTPAPSPPTLRVALCLERVVYSERLHGDGVSALIVSIVAGLATLPLVWARRYETARYTAALAVAAIIAGWALAQQPVFLRDLTIEQAAAGHDTLVAVVVAVLGGAAILFPSLALLFRLVLGGGSATARPPPSIPACRA
jgi:hypothetical protein